MITDSIGKRITEAMKARDEIRLSTLKLLSSELHNQKIAKQKDLTQEEELEVVRREAKKRKDAIDIYEKVLRQNSGQAGAKDRADKEKKELEILQEFLPAQLSDEVLVGIVDEAIKQIGANSMADMGKVIGFVMKKASGQVDGGRVSQLVKEKLS